jgi:hypothetical protein
MLKVPSNRIGPDAPAPGAGLPWASALNASDDHGDVTVTLLTLSLVDDLMRVAGVLRVRSRSDLRITTIPRLDVTLPDGTSSRLVDARTQPHGAVSWVSWTYERPAIDAGRLEARIDHIELEHRVGGTARVDVAGPWAFRFSVDLPTPTEADYPSDDRRGRT